MKGKNNSSLTRKQKRLQLQPKPDDGVSVKPGEPLNGALSALAGTSTGDGVVMSDAVEAPPDLKSLIVTHAKVVEDVPKFTAKVKAWLEFFVTYEAADDDTKAQVRTQAMQGQRFIEQALFDNASVTTKRVAWHMVLVRKFQKTFANLVEVADYLAQLCKDGYLVELKAGVRSPLRIYEEVRFDSQQREVIGGYEAFYGFPATSQDDPEPIIPPDSKAEDDVVSAYKSMLARVAAESRKRWTAELDPFLAKWSKGSLTPAQYAERQVGHCLFYLPSKVGTKRVGEGKGARSVSVFREGGYLVMQNKKDQKRGGGEEVHSYLVAFLNDASDNRCNGRFERTLRACSVFRPPVYIDPAWAVGHGCPRMEGTMGKVRFDIAVTVQRAYQHWAGAAEQSSEVEEGGEQATEQSGEKQ